MKIRSKNITSISYILISPESPFVSPILPPEAFTNNPIIKFIRECPEDLFQLDSPLDYYAICLKSNIGGYDLKVFTNGLHVEDFGFDNRLRLVFIDCSTKSYQEIYERILKTQNDLIYFCFFSEKKNKWHGYEKEVSSPFSFIEKIVLNQNDILKKLGATQEEISPLVRLEFKDFSKFQSFSPTHNNYFLLNNLIGNFCAPFLTSQTDKSFRKEVETVHKNSNSWDRQNLHLEQIEKRDNLTKVVYNYDYAKRSTFNEPLYAPLILIFPFHNPSFKLMYEEKYIAALLVEQTNNYVSQAKSEVILFAAEVIKQRLHFLDDVAFMHSSFTKSPVVRLPVKGSSIYRELSFFSTSSFDNMVKPSFRKKLKQTIYNLGKKLKEKYTSPELETLIINRNSQIIAISDIPVEWLLLDGIPFLFTHDICRLPETTMHSLIGQYSINNLLEFSVSKNIIENTLVIFGSDEPEFEVWQKKAKDLSKSINFKTVQCNTLAEVKKAVEENKPQLLIFDCHGGYDKVSQSTYLWIGDEKLTNDYVVKNNISAPLMFISACGVSPTYTLVNSITNGFFEAGAQAITTTYVPISIDGGSVIYIRLLMQLSIAAKDPVHKNWLNFVCHIIRTSIIHDAHLKVQSENLKPEKSAEYLNLNSRILTESMFFEMRRGLYSDIDNRINELSTNDKKKEYFESAIPEYLLYSNLGRSDLILFDSWIQKHEEANQNL